MTVKVMFEMQLYSSAVPTEAQRLKKRVSWAEDSNLVSVHYFEMDESERGKIFFCCFWLRHCIIIYMTLCIA